MAVGSQGMVGMVFVMDREDVSHLDGGVLDDR